MLGSADNLVWASKSQEIDLRTRREGALQPANNITESFHFSGPNYLAFEAELVLQQGFSMSSVSDHMQTQQDMDTGGLMNLAFDVRSMYLPQ